MTFHCGIGRSRTACGHQRGGKSRAIQRKRELCATPFTSFAALANHLTTYHAITHQQLQELAKQYREEQQRD